MIRKVSSLLFLLFIAGNTFGSHLSAIDMVYKYLGQNAQNQPKYELTVFHFIDNFSSQVPPDDTISVGIYKAEGNRDLVSVIKISLSKTEDITDYVSCYNAPMIILKASYSAIITLPDNGEYILANSRCCRDRSKNLKDATSGPDQGFYITSIIPDSSLINSSCRINSTIWALSINDSNVINLNPVDPDGDSVSISIVSPVDAYFTNLSAPIPNYPLKFETPHNVTMKIGYGDSSYWLGDSSIFEQTEPGKFRIQAKKGSYYVAFRIDEYRNGSLVGSRVVDALIEMIDLPSAGPPPTLPLILGYGKGRTVQLNWHYCHFNQESKIFRRKSTEGSYTLIDSTAVYPGAYIDSNNLEINSVYIYYVEVHHSGSLAWTSNKDTISFGGLSLDELPSNPDFSIRPNPSDGIFHIVCNAELHEYFIVYDLRGKQILMQHASDPLIDLSSYEAGMYIIRSNAGSYRIIKW